MLSSVSNSPKYSVKNDSSMGTKVGAGIGLAVGAVRAYKCRGLINAMGDSLVLNGYSKTVANLSKGAGIVLGIGALMGLGALVGKGVQKLVNHFKGEKKSEKLNAGGDVKMQPDLYSDEEINAILEKVGALKTGMPTKYEVTYYPEKETLVINNKACTNDTTEIYKDGSAINVGSWHRKELGQKGDFKDIIKDAQKRYNKINK